MTFEDAYSRVRERSWLSEARLRALWASTKHVMAQNVPGAIVECGCATGGSAALLGMASAGRRALYLFDGFAGMPEPTERDPDQERAAQYVGHCKGTQREVEAFLADCGVTATIEAGLYSDTLPSEDPLIVALLHIDCDWHDSVMAALRAFYGRVSPGGRIHIDDYYHWQGCRKAVDDFLSAIGSTERIHAIDESGVYLAKGSAA